MNFPSNTLEFRNYVYRYEIVKNMAYDFMPEHICAKPHSRGKEKLIKADYPNKPIYLDAVNLSLTNPQKIIAFCDCYGLFQPSGKDMSSAMDINLFYQCIIIIKSLFHVHENLHDKTNGSTPDILLQYLLTLLSSRYPLDLILTIAPDSSPRNYILPCIENTGNTFQLLGNLINNLIPQSQIPELTFSRPFSDAPSDVQKDLEKFITELEKEKISFSIDKYGMFSLPQNFKFTATLKDTLYAIAPKILAWRIQELLKDVCHEFLTNAQGKFTLHWKINTLFEYMVLALAFDFSDSYYYARCQNINCGYLYIPTKAGISKYCCKECRDAVSQRNRTKKKKENLQQTENNATLPTPPDTTA